MSYKVNHYYNQTVGKLFMDPEARFWLGAGGSGSSFITSITTTGTSGAATVTTGVLNIPQYTGTVASLTTTGSSGAATLISGVLNVPNYTGTFSSLTTTGSSGAATLIAGVLNVPQYASGNISVVTKNANYPTTATDDVILVDASGGPVQITLLTPASLFKPQRVKKIDSSANAVTVIGAAGTIDGSASAVWSVPNTSYTFVSNLTNYFIV